MSSWPLKHWQVNKYKPFLSPWTNSHYCLLHCKIPQLESRRFNFSLVDIINHSDLIIDISFIVPAWSATCVFLYPSSYTASSIRLFLSLVTLVKRCNLLFLIVFFCFSIGLNSLVLSRPTSNLTEANWQIIFFFSAKLTYFFCNRLLLDIYFIANTKLIEL